ncbi:hypothetical protein K440DRAFT_657106 [Wilcoxina mikolae CBS 423.85]|nr:hypothetical protein K440DRAFT_657106 [Wilcoxina mikolae CBS 423.85]
MLSTFDKPSRGEKRTGICSSAPGAGPKSLVAEHPRRQGVITACYSVVYPNGIVLWEVVCECSQQLHAARFLSYFSASEPIEFKSKRSWYQRKPGLSQQGVLEVHSLDAPKEVRVKIKDRQAESRQTLLHIRLAECKDRSSAYRPRSKMR